MLATLLQSIIIGIRNTPKSIQQLAPEEKFLSKQIRLNQILRLLSNFSTKSGRRTFSKFSLYLQVIFTISQSLVYHAVLEFSPL